MKNKSYILRIIESIKFIFYFISLSPVVVFANNSSKIDLVVTQPTGAWYQSNEFYIGVLTFLVALLAVGVAIFEYFTNLNLKKRIDSKIDSTGKQEL